MFTRQRGQTHDSNYPIAPDKEIDRKSLDGPPQHRPARVHSRGISAFRRRVRRGMLLSALCGAIFFLYKWIRPSEAARFAWGHKNQVTYKASCPNYGEYAMRGHAPYSDGPLKLASQRPVEECRTFRSEYVEKVIADVTNKMADKDLARLFENCFANTLDTTIRWHLPDYEKPQSFVITGDINAEWLRDSTNQLAPYTSLLAKDAPLALLFRGAIAIQAEYISTAPYCNAFQPPKDSHIPPVLDHQTDRVHPIYDPTEVFECKYELDSLASFLKLSRLYHEKTGDLSFVTPTWLKAIALIIGVLEQQSQPTFDPVTGQAKGNQYSFQRNTNIGTETLPLAGLGNPLNANTSLIRSAFRPSDDTTILQFLIPSNAFMSVELGHISHIFKKLKKSSHISSEAAANLAATTKELSDSIANGINRHAVFDHAIYGRVYAFEIDGYGSRIFMDDANLPSLLSLPLVGFLEKSDPVYMNTRRMVLSRQGNPYFLSGPEFEGIGGPHIGLRHAWPMSVIVQIMTSDDDDEILRCLDMLKRSTGGLGLMHESVNVKRVKDYTRPWFAWANGLFGEMILDLIERKPELVLDKEYKHSRDG